MSSYDFEFQSDIVQSCFLIHNFVCINQLYGDEFYNVEDLNNPIAEDDENEDDDEEGVNMQALKI